MSLARSLAALLVAVLAFAAVAATAAAESRKVYLNGIDLDNVQVKDLHFPACDVRFDRDGNVFINAPGFEIRKKPAATGAADTTVPRAAPPTQRYFLVSNETRQGAVQYDIDVRINDRLVKTVRSHRGPIVMEITEYLQAGRRNYVLLVARKNLGASSQRISFSPADRLEIVVGVGSVDKGVVSVTRPLVTYVRNASEIKDYTDKYELQVR